MFRGFCVVAAAGLALAGCARQVPDDTRQGVGFGDYASYHQTQGRTAAQAQLSGQTRGPAIVPPRSSVAAAPTASGSDPI
ncbi:hypothetical protein HKCCE3408_19015, partial [Rhodobacterales bacterium HKCCE3408]|nr:hypothetical protein [Rhodobacterales bacterium HKCCE3408]